MKEFKNKIMIVREVKKNFTPIEISLSIETREEAERLKKLLEKEARVSDDFNVIINLLNSRL